MSHLNKRKLLRPLTAILVGYHGNMFTQHYMFMYIIIFVFFLYFVFLNKFFTYVVFSLVTRFFLHASLCYRLPAIIYFVAWINDKQKSAWQWKGSPFRLWRVQRKFFLATFRMQFFLLIFKRKMHFSLVNRWPQQLPHRSVFFFHVWCRMKLVKQKMK